MKLHPLSIPYRTATAGGWTIALVIAVTATVGTLTPVRVGVPVVLGLGVLALLTVGAWAVAYHRRFEFGFTRDTLVITSGVVSRRTREIPVDRVQNVDIRQGPVSRLLGLAEVSIETAGGRGAEAQLRYVDRATATALQERIDGRAPTGDAADEPRPLYAISAHELAVLSLTSVDWRALGFVLAAAVGLVPTWPAELPDVGIGGVRSSMLDAAALPIVAILGNAAVWTARFYRFRLWSVDHTLRYDRGLVRREGGSIPLDRVQLLRIRDNPATRALGYAALDIETAGHGPAEGTEVRAAVPIGTRERVWSLARAVEPFGAVELSRPPERARRRYAVRYAIVLAAITIGLYAVSRFAVPLPWYLALGIVPLVPVAAHLTWLHRGYAVGDNYLVVRGGFWRRTTAVVPYYRIQTVATTATPFQRRWALATIGIDTASGTPAAVDLDAATATALRDDTVERLHADRRRRRRRRP